MLHVQAATVLWVLLPVAFTLALAAIGSQAGPPTVLQVRNDAANCYLAANFSPSAAGERFVELHPDAVIKDPGRYCKKWFKRRKQRASVADLPGKGRKCKVSEARAAAHSTQQHPIIQPYHHLRGGVL